MITDTPLVKGAIAAWLEQLDDEMDRYDHALARSTDPSGLLLHLDPESTVGAAPTVYLSPTVTKFVRSRADVVVLYGSRGEGKTTAGVVRVLDLAQEFPAAWPVRVSVVRDTWRNIERTIIPTLEQGHQRGWWTCDWREGKTQCVVNGGVATLYFWGMDHESDANKFQGFECGILWLEEPAPAADLMSGIPATVLAIGVTSLRQWGVHPSVQITMNPPDQDHWTQELAEELEERGHPDMRIEQFRIPPGENQHLPAGYRERMRLLLEAAGRQDLVRRLVEGNVGNVQMGVPVTPEFSDLHIAKGPIAIRWGWPTFRGFDFGLSPSCVWVQISPSGFVHTLGCIVGVNMGIEELIEQHVIPWEVKYGLRRPRRGTPFGAGARRGFTIRDIGDPAGYQRDQSSSERSARRSLENLLHTTLERGPVAWPPRRDAVKAVLTRMIGGAPKVQIDPECVPLIRGLRGMWRYAKYPSGRVSDEPIKDVNCVTDDVEILTLEGWRTHHGLQPGQTVFGYDPARHCLVRVPLLAVHRYEGSHRVLRFRSASLDLTVTPNHRMVVGRQHHGAATRLVAADALSPSDTFLRAAPAIDNRRRWYTDDFVRIVAWIFTEGTWRPGGAWHICQSVSANAPYCEELETLVTRFGGWRVHDRRCDTVKPGSVQRVWRIRGEIADAVSAVLDVEKRPTLMFLNRLTGSQRRLFLYEVLRGDGTWGGDACLPPPPQMPRLRAFFVRPGTPVLVMKDSVAVDRLHYLATLAGFRASILPMSSREWKLTLAGTWSAWSSVKVETTETTAPFVWCPQTPTHTWVARSAGRVVVTGNSHPCDAWSYIIATLFPVHELTETLATASPRQIVGGPTSHWGV